MSLERARFMGKVMRVKYLMDQGKKPGEIVTDTGLPESVVRELYDALSK